MKTETREIYKCDHCNKLYQRKHSCIYHEKKCTKNPDNIRLCHNCIHLKKVSETIWAGYSDFWGNESERKVDVLFCEKIDSYIHPPLVAIKGNAFDMGDKCNIEMPKECKTFEQKTYYDTFI